MRTTKVCSSVQDWMKPVRGKTGDYIVTFGPNEDPERSTRFDFACTCPAFQYRKDRNDWCKHIKQVADEHCGHGLTPEVVKVDITKRLDDACPKCGTAMREARTEPPVDEVSDLDAQIAAKSAEKAKELGLEPKVVAVEKPLRTDDMDDWF